MPTTSHPLRLPVAKVLVGALLIPWLQRRTFLRLMLYPALVFFAARSAAILLPWTGVWPQFVHWIAMAGYGVAFAMFAVRCHRLMLLPDPAPEGTWLIGWSRRETRFAVAFVVALIAWNIAFWLSTTVLLNSASVSSAADAYWVMVPGHLLAGYVFARLSLVLPARALDRPVGLRWAWQASRSNGWRLAVVVVLWPWLLNRAVDLVYRDEATAWEWIAISVLAVALAVAQVAALSLAYRELAADLPDTVSERPRSSRLLLAVLLTALLVVAAVFKPLAIGSRVSCSVRPLASVSSPDGRFRAELEHEHCDDGSDAGLRLRLREGSTGMVIYTRPTTEEAAGDWRKFVAWSWSANDQLDVLVLEANPAADLPHDKQWRRVKVRYRLEPSSDPQSLGR